MQAAVRDNYYALCICVLTERIPEQAFVDIGLATKQQKPKIRKRAAVNNLSGEGEAPEDVREILALRQTHTWKQIGEMFGISDKAAYQRVRRYSKRGEGGQ